MEEIQYYRINVRHKNKRISYDLPDYLMDYIFWYILKNHKHRFSRTKKFNKIKQEERSKMIEFINEQISIWMQKDTYKNYSAEIAHAIMSGITNRLMGEISNLKSKNGLLENQIKFK